MLDADAGTGRDTSGCIGMSSHVRSKIKDWTCALAVSSTRSRAEPRVEDT